MTGIVIGVDTGISGAISVVMNGELVAVDDMPVDLVDVKRHKGVSKLNRVSAVKLAALLAPYADQVAIQPFRMVVEIPTFRPIRHRDKRTGRTLLKQPGTYSVTLLSENVGMLKMAAAAFKIPFYGVQPGQWKRALGLFGDKQTCRVHAQSMFPQWAQHLSRVKDEGRSESALLAWYGWHHIDANNVAPYVSDEQGDESEE